MFAFIAKRIIKEKIIIISVDGGIASQIGQYVLGDYYVKKGYKVKYDLTWFKKFGKDMLGKHVYNFDLLKMFPTIDFLVATDLEVFLYKNFFPFNFSNKNQRKFEQNPPRYLGGYCDHSFFYKDIANLFTIDWDVLDDFNRMIFTEIYKQKSSIGIHVRRGDMTSNKGYWQILTSIYYVKAINIVLEKFGDSVLYLFSDEMEWVKDNIVPELKSLNYVLVDSNDSTKGYMDLVLLSACNHLIASEGSLARFAFLLTSNKKNKLMIMPSKTKENNYSKTFENIILLDYKGDYINE